MNGGGMAEPSKDPAIKLFGMKIPVPDARVPAEPEIKEIIKEKARTQSEVPLGDCPEVPDKPTILNNVKEEERAQNQAQGMQQVNAKARVSETNAEQEKVFKRPDKILPCPRCNSLETKFCYFNNYNVNQPRHFCKNCQRYWTAGGTMRNVPVGAGRRKNKQFASQYRQIIVSPDGVPIRGVETQSPTQHQLVSPSGNNGAGTVLKFGPEPPLCESMETVLNLGDQKRSAEAVPMENREEHSSCASPNTQQPVHAYAPPPWAPVQWGPQPVFAVPGFAPPNMPLQFVPASYWGCMATMWPGSAGNISLSRSNSCLSPTSSTSNNSCCSGNGSPTLGKHSRDPSIIVEEEQSEKGVVVPKTLRVDDPDEASKSPIWTTLGINKPDQNDPRTTSVIFKSLEPRKDRKDGKVDGVGGKPILGANPAALSRSHTFQEST